MLCDTDSGLERLNSYKSLLLSKVVEIIEDDQTYKIYNEKVYIEYDKIIELISRCDIEES